LDTKVLAGIDAMAGVELNFHFSCAPTATAGYYVFWFDIKK
jgi:hypothetical protein